MVRKARTGGAVESVVREVTGSAAVESRRPLLIMAALIGACIVAYVVFLGAAAILQLGNPEEVEMDVARVATRNDAFVGNRGTIFDSSGHRVLAVTVSDTSVRWTGGGWDDDFVRVANGLATALDMDRDEIYRKFQANIGKGVVVKRHISEIEEEQIRLQNLPWVVLEPDRRRYYPLEIVMGSALGYLAPDSKKNDVMRGMLGVEEAYNDILSPKTRKVRFGRTSNLTSQRDAAPAEGWLLDGADLDLAVDARLQIVLDNALHGAMVREQAAGGMAVMLDARTFEVLAMSSYPFLDPNQYQEACATRGTIDDGSSPCVNKALTYRYEPGSVAKMLSLAAGLESGQFSLGTIVNGSNGSCFIGGKPVTDLIRKGFISLADAIKYSSNCAMQDMARHLDPQYLHDMYVRFGIGQKSGIDMPDKADESINRNWSSVDARVAAYGYGFRSTLINLAAAFATITNDGVRLEPRVVKQIRKPDGTFEAVKAGEGIRVVSSATASSVRQALRRVVMEDDGTGKAARPKLYTAGGKTGTSRIAGSTREEKRANCSFVGFAPADDPRIVIAVTVIYPKVHFAGGSTAGPVFAEVVDKALPILGIEPESRPEPEAAVTAVAGVQTDDRR